ncbi:MAG: HAD family hydrolase [Chloroflexi bacterium]|nr:HAD family hydrolase [Chloroflexota bacterium]
MTKKPAVKIISLDMDGTLVQPEFVNGVWLEGIPALYARQHKRDLPEATKLVREAYDSVGQEAREWYDIRYWLDRFALPSDLGELMESYKDRISFYPEVPEVLERLKQKYPLIVVSNAAQEFLNIEMESLKDHFSHIFSCVSHFGRVKKDSSVYRDICRTLGIAPEEMYHVGDHFEFDYVAPSSLGIRACYVDRTGSGNGPDTVKDLREFEVRLSKE